MKKTALFILLLTTATAYAQNMVPNGDFENYTGCPTGYSQIANCTGWRAYHGGSTDYYNCTGTMGTPVNVTGYQIPASGTAYIGMITHNGTAGSYKEYAARAITPLNIGTTYEVSISVNLSNRSGYTTNDFGVWFYDNGLTSTGSGTAYIPVTPQVSYFSSGAVTDTTNWVRLVGIFTADSAYDNIVIGGFGGSTTTYQNTTTFGTSPMSTYAYYLVDSVVVKVYSHINMTFTDSLLCAGDTIYVPHTVNPTNYFNTNNVFTLQLSNSSGSFASPVNIGTRTGNTGGTIVGVIPTGTISGAGYRIRIIASSPGDTSGTNGKNIGIGNPKPAKPVAANNGPMCSGNTLNLTATTTTSGVSWKWTGPNSFTSTLQNPSITNAQAINAGSYIVTAFIYGCTAKDTTNAGVSATSGAAIASSNAPICDNDTLKLSCSGTGSVISYTWTGPNSFSSSLQNPTIIHPTSAATGDYYLSVALSGCTILDTVSVLIKPTPIGLTASSNSPVCNGDSIKLFAGSTTTGVTYLWTGPNAYSAFVQNPAIANAASVNAGTYTVSYLLNGCNAQNTTTVVVNPRPAPVTATVNGPICAGSMLSLTSATTTSGVSYSWIGPNSFSSSTQNPNITNVQTAASGDYIVTAMLGLCGVRDTVTALVKPMPANTAASNNSPVCQGGTLSLAANTTSAGATFSWTGPNSFSSTQQNPNISNVQPVATGNYIVTFNLNGCSSNANTSAIINPLPAKPTAGSNTPVCSGTTLNLTASTVSGATYSWTGPAAFTSGNQNPSVNNITSTMSGSYIVRTLDNGCYSLPDTAVVTVIPAPNVNIYPNPNDTICLGSNVTFVAVTSNAGSSTSYRWLKNNNPISGATAASYSSTGIADGDIIFCEMTAAGVCPSVYKDSSNKIAMTVLPWLAPSVSITSNPSTPLSPYQLVTFTANAINAGTAPGYQWKRNGTDVVGATSFTWGTYQLSDNDDISVVVVSSYMCPQPPTATSNAIKVTVLTGINNINERDDIKVYPNPVSNELIIEGAAKGTVLQLFDVLGRVIYTSTINSQKQSINTSAIVKGAYLFVITEQNGDRHSYKLVKE